MRLPEHFGIELDAQDHADLKAARTAFVASMNGLEEKQQLARATVLAKGVRPADPLSRSLAKQVVDAAAARNEIKSLQGELAEIERDLRDGGYRPRDPDWRGKALVRQEDVRKRIEYAHARLIGIAEDDLATAQKKAAVHFRQTREAARKAAALKEAVARVEARLDAETIEQQAEALVRGRRMAEGRKVPRSRGESQ